MVKYRLGNKIVEGSVIKENPLTVWIKAPDGKIIKRHKIKHGVIKLEK